MTDRPLDGSTSGAPPSDDGGIAGDGRCYDYDEMCDELRCHSSESLHLVRLEAVAEQRSWRLRELAVTAVLDERGQLDDATAGKDGTSTKTARRTRKTAAKLKRQPKIAEAAAKGTLSEEQLDKVTELAGDDPEADRLWAEQGPLWSPEDLADELRRQRKPSVEDAAARREARSLRYWWNRDSGMLDGRFSLPDVDGATLESLIDELIGKMKPPAGQAWDSHDHRRADALVDLCRAYRDGGAKDGARAGERSGGQTGAKPHFVVEIPLTGPATCAGVPLPDEMIERLRAQARIEPVLKYRTMDGETVVIGKTEPALSEKKKRAVRRRDRHCRYPGCRRHGDLEVHHLWPVSWGGSDELYNLACLCPYHHALMAPQGRVLLLGNPNHPAGLTLLDRDDLPKLAQLAAEQSRADQPAA